MKTKNIVAIVSVLFAISACSGSSQDSSLVGSPQENLAIRETVHPQSEDFLQVMVKEEHFSGVALVMRMDEVIHAKGYGNASSENRNSVETVFHVASITKQFTAAAVMQLVEAGLVDLETSVNEYLPKKYRSQNWDSVKIHHLLSHSSGVPDYAVERDYYNVVDGFCLGDTVDGMVKEAMGKDLEFEPGSSFSYSNIGFTLLGFVIQQQTSQPYEEYLKINILDPMGMDSSRVHVVGHEPVANEAAGYRWDEVLGTLVPDDVVSLPVTAPDGGLLTTLADFAKWSAIYFGGKSTILSRQSLEMMTCPTISTPWTDARGAPLSYGYGLFVGEGLLSHAGYIVGFRSHFIVDREQQLLVAVFSNNTANDPARITEGLLKIADASSLKSQ